MLLYNIGIWLYGLAVRMVSPFNTKARAMVRGRKNIFDRLDRSLADRSEIPLVWVHCASLGEFEQGRPIVEAIRKEYPRYRILLTFFSPSGYEVRKNYEGADYVFYLPLDTARNARRFVRALRPEIAIFIKYEFWLNYLKALRKAGCRTFIASAVFRRDSVFFRWYGSAFRRALGCFERLFVQNRQSAELLEQIGVTDVTVAGDTRFDRVAAIAKAARRLEPVERFARGAQVFVAGSTWPQDEELILELIGREPDLKFIVAPHEIDRGRIEEFVRRSGVRAALYTDGEAEQNISQARLLVIDTIGVLSSVYQYADYAYIGGGFGVGIHNTLEAATFGLPIAFGPNYQKFVEARELISAGAAESVQNADQLDSWLCKLRKDGELYENIRQKARYYVESKEGATRKFIDCVFGSES